MNYTYKLKSRCKTFSGITKSLFIPTLSLVMLMIGGVDDAWGGRNERVKTPSEALERESMRMYEVRQTERLKTEALARLEKMRNETENEIDGTVRRRDGHLDEQTYLLYRCEALLPQITKEIEALKEGTHLKSIRVSSWRDKNLDGVVSLLATKEEVIKDVAKIKELVTQIKVISPSFDFASKSSSEPWLEVQRLEKVLAEMSPKIEIKPQIVQPKQQATEVYEWTPAAEFTADPAESHPGKTERFAPIAIPSAQILQSMIGGSANPDKTEAQARQEEQKITYTLGAMKKKGVNEIVSEEIRNMLEEAQTKSNEDGVVQPKIKLIADSFKEGTIEVVHQVSEEVSEVAVNNMMKSITAAIVPAVIKINEQRTGAASGSGLDNLGVWMQAFAGLSAQSKNDENDAYRSTGFGGSIGFDTGNDVGVIGVSYNFSKSNLLFGEEDVSESNPESKAKTNLLSIYSSYFITPHICFAGQGGGGISNLEVRDKSKKVGVIFFGNATGKYFINISEVFSIVPKAGFELFRSHYSDQNKKSITNVDVNSSRGVIFGGVGIKADIVNNDISISPELSVGAELLLFGDEKKMLDNIHVPSKISAEELDRLVDNLDKKIILVIDGSLNIVKSSLFKATLGVHTSMAKDFYSVGGFVKLSVNM
jgi:hypothetical protein